MGNIRFSVVTVCYNAGQALLDTVEKTLEQTCTDFEIIVKDGLSTDGSVEKLPRDPRIQVVRSKDAGIYDAMNQAVAASSGEYIIFMNCGDWFYSPEALQAVSDSIDETYGQVYYGRVYNRLEKHVSDYPREITRLTCFRTMICHQATVYAAKLLKERGYDLSYRILADKEMLMYLVCEKKIRPIYVDAVIADYEGGGESSKKKHAEQNARDTKRMLDRYYPKSEQLRYRAMMALTMPKLRHALAHSPRFGKVYYGITKRLYSLRKK